ncbi:MAG: response regulator [Candidatus Aminicenantes bacterium]
MGDEEEAYNIMIVEDSENHVVVLRHVLEQQGWEVVWANSAEKALEMLSSCRPENSPDLIIIDYQLQGSRGDELCRRLKLNIKTRSIPTLMLTEEDSGESHGLKSGADDYFPKSNHDDILVLKIKSLQRQSRGSHVLFGVGGSLFWRSRILAIDDNPTYLKFLDKSFKNDGIRIEKAFSGKEALEKIKKNKYDCILVDLVMPGIDGIEICQKIMEMRGSLEEPMVLMLTAYESKEDMTRALEAGADDFVGKSSDISIIKARMSALLRRKFIQEDNQRIFEELKRKELEVERSRIETAAAETKAMLAEKLLNTVEQLEKEIEERKRMELKIKNYSRELELSNKELESFAYVASHDLQEPLRTISSYLQLVEKRYKDNLDDKGKDFINRAVNGALRMQKMINDLLEYSRITTCGKTFKLYSLGKILDRVLTNLSPTIKRKNALVTRGPLPRLTCDESQLLRLFQNLLSNALKFCDRSQPVIRISAKKQTNHWRLSVKDNGIGIDPSNQEIIFKIFQRLHGKDKYPGTGIGLAICQKIVERHEGKIWVKSQPGKGSTFFFTLKIQMSG